MVKANSWGLPAGLLELFLHKEGYEDYYLQGADKDTEKYRPKEVAVFMMGTLIQNNVLFENIKFHQLFVAEKRNEKWGITGESKRPLPEKDRVDWQIEKTEEGGFFVAFEEGAFYFLKEMKNGF